jgi:hypothetical protein
VRARPPTDPLAIVCAKTVLKAFTTRAPGSRCAICSAADVEKPTVSAR